MLYYWLYICLQFLCVVAASSLSPKKWGISGDSGFVLIGAIALYSILGNNFNIDLRPIAAIIVGLGLLDSIYLGGTVQAQALSLWLPYKRRISVHEAGHVLVGELWSCTLHTCLSFEEYGIWQFVRSVREDAAKHWWEVNFLYVCSIPARVPSEGSGAWCSGGPKNWSCWSGARQGFYIHPFLP